MSEFEQVPSGRMKRTGHWNFGLSQVSRWKTEPVDYQLRGWSGFGSWKLLYSHLDRGWFGILPQANRQA